MDLFFEYLKYIMKYLHIITVILIVVKSVMAFRNRDNSLSGVVGSFFRIYSRSDFFTDMNQGRKNYMILNNVINNYIYIWGFLSVAFLVVFRRLF